MIRRLIITVGLITLASASGASAQHQGSMEDQVACTPDVYRLCSAMVPDEDRIVACLERNKPNLSPACRRVFSDPAPSKGGQGNSDNDDD